MADGVEALNDMLAAMSETLDFEHTTLKATDDFPHPDSLLQGTGYLLAVQLTDTFNQPLTLTIAKKADQGSALFASKYFSLPNTSHDATLTSMIAHRRYF
ncbi:hypothetical protein E1160_10390 [Rhodospirillaceae bacterium RKSG073]|nr:hypothetical protein [Curvivirga aplysinae]